ncbi:hypothetical protein, partial [Aeromonas allosaccharophila]
MMNPFSWLQMTNMISYQGLVRTFPRATSIAGPEITLELSRLSKENSELRERLKLFDMNKDIKQREEFLKLKQMMSSIDIKLSLRLDGYDDWSVYSDATLYSLYNTLASEISIEISVERASSYIGLIYNPDKSKPLSNYAPFPYNEMRNLFLSLSALNLVEPSKKKHPVSDNNEYWSLSDYGLSFLKFIRLNVLESKAKKKIIGDRKSD